MKETTAVKSSRAGVYALLAEALAPPPHEEALLRLSNGTWLTEMLSLLNVLKKPVGIPAVIRNSALTPGELANEYLRSFFLPDGLRIWLVESVYNPWTMDESAEVAFKSETGWLGGDAAAHMQELVSRLGLELPPEVRGTPDHLAVELELMSFLVEEAGPDAQAIFLAQHLNWLPLLLARSEEAGLKGLYRAVLDMTKQFIAWDRK